MRLTPVVHHRRPNRVGRWAGLALLVVLGSACGGGSDAGRLESMSPSVDVAPGNGSEPALGPVSVNPTESLPLPFNDLQLAPDEYNRAFEVEAATIQDCMAEQGVVVDGVPVLGVDPGVYNLRRYGLLSREQAAEHGYYPARTETDRQVAQDWSRFIDGLTPEGYELFNRCGTMVHRDLGQARLERLHGRLQDLGSVSVDLMFTDSRVVEVTREWSDCMADAGFDYGDPFDASGDPRWGGDDADRPTPAEVEVAVADVECKRAVNWAGILLAVETGYQTRLLAEERELIETYQEQVAEVVRLTS